MELRNQYLKNDTYGTEKSIFKKRHISVSERSASEALRNDVRQHECCGRTHPQ